LSPPNPDTLRKKSKNQRRDFGLRRIADGSAWWRIRLMDKFANVTGNQIGFRRILHVTLGDVSRLRDFGIVLRVRLRTLAHILVRILSRRYNRVPGPAKIFRKVFWSRIPKHSSKVRLA
jgi:hypothetical protein